METSTASTPPIGRDAEVNLLVDRWALAQEGMGQVVLIVGEAGLGKSRLVQTIKHHVLVETSRDPVSEAHAVSPIIAWHCSQRSQTRHRTRSWIISSGCLDSIAKNPFPRNLIDWPNIWRAVVWTVRKSPCFR